MMLEEYSRYHESRCLFRFEARIRKAANTLCHAGRTSICIHVPCACLSSLPKPRCLVSVDVSEKGSRRNLNSLEKRLCYSWKTRGCWSALWQVLRILRYTRNLGGLQEPGKHVSEKSLVSCDAVGILLLFRAKAGKVSNMLRHAVRTKNTWCSTKDDCY